MHLKNFLQQYYSLTQKYVNRCVKIKILKPLQSEDKTVSI